MKRVGIILFIGIFLSLVSKYIFDTLSPFNTILLEELIISKKIQPGDWTELSKQLSILINNGVILKYLTSNAYLAASTLLLSVLCFFVALHLSIDKIFFKNYFQPPSLFNAIRRGGLLIVTIGALFFLKLYGLDPSFFITIPILSLVIELLFFFHIFTIFNRNEIKSQKIPKIDNSIPEAVRNQ